MYKNRSRDFTTKRAERQTRVLTCLSEASAGSKAVRGFTLIELLVVIAIIGILSAVVLASLNTARSKGSDAAIMSDITGIRTQAAIYLNDNGNYGPVSAGVVTDCTAASGNLFSDPTVS